MYAVAGDRRAVLMRAAEIIERRGHCKRAYTQDGRLCALAAVALAEREVSGRDAVVDVIDMRVDSDAMRHLRGETFQETQQVCEWNNLDETTGEVVAAKFREMAHAV